MKFLHTGHAGQFRSASDIDIAGACFSLIHRKAASARRGVSLGGPPRSRQEDWSIKMTLMQVGLDDKYRLEAKRIYLSGVQALVRLPMLQRERDRTAGLNTAGFISGYRGSPLGMYDHTLWRAKSFLQAHDIAFVPGLNEDLAATAVWGSQQVGLFPGAKVDGVFGIWYGKGPGGDRAVDAVKLAK
jgi:indolepyruvate ferredoxin oxidoreductase